MLYTAFVIGSVLFVVVLSFYLMIYMISLVYSTLMGSPYVRSKGSALKRALDEAGLKAGDTLIDLGCGDGFVVFTAAQKYGATAIGVDINPLLIWRAKIIAAVMKIPHVTFLRENIFRSDISQANIIYLFLLPEFLVKLKPKLQKESKKGALIISHGFQIDGWKEYRIKTIPQKPFSTYFYKLS